MSDSATPVDCSLPGSSVHEISQARIMEWVAISFSRDQTWVSHTAGRFFTVFRLLTSNSSFLTFLLTVKCLLEMEYGVGQVKITVNYPSRPFFRIFVR